MVYLVRDNLSGLWKLGYTKNLDKRLESLRTQSPSLELLLVVPGSRDHERDLLAGCSRVYGEWIYPNGHVLDRMKALRDSRYHLAHLTPTQLASLDVRPSQPAEKARQSYSRCDTVSMLRP